MFDALCSNRACSLKSDIRSSRLSPHVCERIDASSSSESRRPCCDCIPFFFLYQTGIPLSTIKIKIKIKWLVACCRCMYVSVISVVSEPFGVFSEKTSINISVGLGSTSLLCVGRVPCSVKELLAYRSLRHGLEETNNHFIQHLILMMTKSELFWRKKPHPDITKLYSSLARMFFIVWHSWYNRSNESRNLANAQL